MAALRFVPFFIFILILYNIIAFSGVDLNATLFTLPLISEATVQFSTSTLLLFLGVVILYIEILKATKTSVATVIDHTLSMIVFVIYIIEFLVVDVCGNDTFFLLMMLSILDVVAGFTITISTAKRDLTVGDSHIQ
ncbi:MAG: hypothetical protein HOM11_05930 [Methylococcales bacterium]|jgi:hypothetical protein|nr:hypothetical protein [Methylococcales bacterium]MBT7445896.1 hypothetical protein [Methylococcales bacterium]